MIKKFLIGVLVAIILVGGGTSVYSALASPDALGNPQPAVESIPTEALQVADDGTNTINNLDQSSASEGTLLATESDLIVSELITDDAAGLLYIYEEEKLARDVYQALYALWGQPTFVNIAKSEQAHMDAVAGLLRGYGLTIPENELGTFNDTGLQGLYNSLMTSGSQSLADALRVGAMIEELDIIDLQIRLTATTDEDIQMVYSNLMNGSFNHMRIFVGVLENQTGEVYQPQYLEADLYQTILSTSSGSEQVRGNRIGTEGATDGRGRGHQGGQH